ncbi:MAG: ferrochelatase, partial [Planctomycetia bacterium]|nr:ferrochelatase [Planctomycetia bacterium]
MAMMRGHDAVVLAGFGGPETPEEVGPFLRSILAGRPISPEREAEIEARYRSVGGRSPFCGEVRSFAGRLSALLADTGVEIPVFTTYLHSP